MVCVFKLTEHPGSTWTIVLVEILTDLKDVSQMRRAEYSTDEETNQLLGEI